MKSLPFQKYRPYPQVDIKNRRWPDNLITSAPTWCSVDLRDGNQALVEPMTVEQKKIMFKLLTEIQFKEIEIGFPAASATELKFCRDLIELGLIPDDVAVQVLCQARDHLIVDTFKALKGVKKVIFHIYNSTSTLQRDVVFRASQKEIIDIALSGIKKIKELRDELGDCEFILQYSPESFTGTELEFSREICEEVVNLWNPKKNEKVILNLPATVELSTPNIFADMIEWMCSHLSCRDSTVISIHPHNDRGCAVAATELALMAGGDRVEGTLFGNGERTGNVDICLLALNLYSQGIDPKLDLAEIDRIMEVYTGCTNLPIHPRHPYAGELVYTAFSGSHQDAINKGFKALEARPDKSSKHWEVPYLHIDPNDLGRTYEAVIRINSQSGKGGVSYVLEQNYGFKLPRPHQIDFGKVVQKYSDAKQKEITSLEIKELFYNEYVNIDHPLSLKKFKLEMLDGSNENNFTGTFELSINQTELTVTGSGNGPIDALTNEIKKLFGLSFRISEYMESALEEGSNARAVCYIAVRHNTQEMYGVGINSNTVLASLEALLVAINRTFPDLVLPTETITA